MKSRVGVGNWPAYDRALVQRRYHRDVGGCRHLGVGKRRLASIPSAIETALTLRLIFHLPLRQTEGFLTSIFGMLGLELSTPDHTTLSRRGQHLDLTLRRAPAGAGLHLMVDSTGLSIVGEGEWAAAKHGGRGRRGWKKLSSRCRPIRCDRRPGPDGGERRRRDDWHHVDRGDRRCPRTGDGGCRLRDDRLLRGRRCAWRDRRGSADEDGQRVSIRTAVARS